MCSEDFVSDVLSFMESVGVVDLSGTGLRLPKSTRTS